MASRITDDRLEHALGVMERVSGYVRQGALVRAAELARLRDDERGISGESAFSVLEKSLFIRTSQSRSMQVWTADGRRQFTLGTEDEVDGGEPFAIGGEDIDGAGYRWRLHGRLGHMTALAGVLQTATHHAYKSEISLRPRGDGSVIVGDDVAAWSTGGPAAGSTTTGRWSLYTTAATNGSAKKLQGPSDYTTSWEVDGRWLIQMGSNIDNERLWVGFFNGDPSGSSTPNLEFAGFRYVGGSETTFKAYTGDGSARTQTDTTITVTANQRYAMRVRLFPTEAQMILGIPEVIYGGNDGTYTVIHTTNLPATTTLLAPWLTLTTLEAVAKSVRWGLFRATSW